MEFVYDIRLTFRNSIKKEIIHKQFYIEDLVFENPISPGDNIVLPNFTGRNNPIDIWCRVESVNHSPRFGSMEYQKGRSYIEAEYRTGTANFEKVEEFLLKHYNCRKV